LHKRGDVNIGKNHNLGECARCLWNEENGYSGCKVFIDKRDVILDDKGCCNARIYKQGEMDKLREDLLNITETAYGVRRLDS